jgi:hypothetical protein
MKKYLSVMFYFCFMLTPQHANAQQIDWAIYDTSDYALNPSYLAVPIAADGNENVYTAWLMEYDQTSSQHAYGRQVISGFSAQGSALFRHTLGNKAEVSALEKTPSGELIIIGTFMDTLSWDSTLLLTVNNPAPNSRNAFLLFLDSTGSVLRSRNLTLTYPDLQEPFHLDIDPYGNAWVAFFSWTTGYAIGLDALGQDSVVRNLSGMQAIMSDFAVDASGSVYVSGGIGFGSFIFAGLPVNVTDNYSSYLAKVDASGNGSWFKTIPDITFQDSKIGVSGNCIYFTRSLSDSVTVEGFHLDGPQWVYDVLTVKYDTAGNVIWAKDIPAQPSITGDLKVGFGNYLVADNSGGYYQLMDYRGQVDLGNFVVVGAPGTTTSRGATLVYYDGNGLPQFHLDVSGVNGLFSYSVALSSNNTGYFSGTARGGAQIGSTAIVTPDPFDFVSWVAKFSQTGTSVSSLNPELLTIYPNPSSGERVCFTTPMGKGILTILDVQGSKVKEILISEKTECIYVDLPNGLYMVNVNSYDGSFTRKLIVQ